MRNFTASFTVSKSPQEVFDAVNNVRGWWGTDVEGSADKIGDEFTYRYQKAHYCKIRVIDIVPNEKVVWQVLENYMKFVQDQTEWVGTTINFEIAAKGDKTELRFAHVGLYPELECYDVCSSAWGSRINKSLRRLITTGTGSPYK